MPERTPLYAGGCNAAPSAMPCMPRPSAPAPATAGCARGQLEAVLRPGDRRGPLSSARPLGVEETRRNPG
jgi:hypothetical protein